MPMISEVCENQRIAYYWLSREEKDDDNMQKELNQKYKEWKNKGYKVCTFVSGSGNLVDLTKELLIHNKLAMAKKISEETVSKPCKSHRSPER